MVPIDYLHSWYTMGGTRFDAEARPQESCSNLLGPLPLCKHCKRTFSLVAFTPVFTLKVASSTLARCGFSLPAWPAEFVGGTPLAGGIISPNPWFYRCASDSGESCVGDSCGV